MKWSELTISRALAMQFFNRKYLVVVPNCSWPGSECDLLCLTENLRVIDIEIKISRSDLRADAKKEKWWDRQFMGYGPRVEHFDAHGRLQKVTQERLSNDTRRTWPRKVWKHYYALPREIWTPELLDDLPSKSSGVLLLSEQQRNQQLIVTCARRAIPCRDAQPIPAAAAIDIARLASLRMWDSFRRLDEARRAA